MNPIAKQLTPLQFNRGKIICFPFAGGSPSAFRPLCKLLAPAQWGVWAIEPAGHGSNRQSLIEDLETMIDTYEKALAPILTQPFVLFGHSLGGLVVYLLTQRLEKKSIFPKAVIISSTLPPETSIQKMSSVSGERLLQFMVSLGGVPGELLNEIELLKFFLKSFRSDLKAVEGYVHQDHTQIITPAYIFGGDSDELCPLDSLQAWGKWVNPVRFYQFQGGHMYWLRDGGELALQIQLILNRAVLPE